jgi:LysM repeat protein
MFRSVAAVVLSMILPTLVSAQGVAQERHRTHEVVKGETLWILAERYLGNPYRWPLIYEANASQIPNANVIEPGQVLVIPGLAEEPATGQEAEAQPELAQIEDVTVATEVAARERPVVSEPPPWPPRRATSEGSELFPWRRTTFYPEPVNQAEQDRITSIAIRSGLASASAITTVAVPTGIAYGADWLIPRGQENSYLGTLEGFSRAHAERTPQGPARIGEGVLITPEPGARFQVGDLLQSFRTIRKERRLGLVQRPSGILVVAEVGDDRVVAMVASEFDRIWMGDWVRPAPAYQAVPGVFPKPTDSDVTATILGFPEERVVQGYGAEVFLDVGSDAGIGIGDVFRAHVGKPGPLFGLESARLQVVSVAEKGSTARIVSVTHPGIEVADRLRLIQKMQ